MNMIKRKGHIFIRILLFMLPEWRLFTIAFFASVILALCWLVPPILIGDIIDMALPGKDRAMLLRLTLMIFGAVALLSILTPLQSHCLALAGERLMQYARTALFDAIQSQSYIFFTVNDFGTISTRFWTDVNEIDYALRTSLLDALSNTVLIAITIGYMLYWDWKLTLFLIGLWPFVFVIGLFAGRWHERATESILSSNEAALSFAFDRLNINGAIIRHGVAYNKVADTLKFVELTEGIIHARVRQNWSRELTNTVLVALPVMSSVIIYAFGGVGVIEENISLGVLVAFAALSVRLASPVGQFASLYINIVALRVVFQRIFEWTDMESDIVEAEDALEMDSVVGHVAFRNVSVRYGGDRVIIDDLSGEFQAGQMVAVVGPSGAGKTTLAYLLMRFFDPDSGVIEIDGRDIRSIKLESLKEHMCLVPQEDVLYNASIRDNLLICKPEASEGELREACELAQLDELLDSLPEGYDSLVGEYGYRLSGGERQRLSIARAILKRPGIVVMDEPTSALDAITEGAIRDVLSNTFGSSTTIVIAHRLSTILNADRILVLDEGKCVDFGSHEQLLARCELYRLLYEEQFADQIAQDVSGD